MQEHGVGSDSFTAGGFVSGVMFSTAVNGQSAALFFSRCLKPASVMVWRYPPYDWFITPRQRVFLAILIQALLHSPRWRTRGLMVGVPPRSLAAAVVGNVLRRISLIV